MPRPNGVPARDSAAETARRERAIYELNERLGADFNAAHPRDSRGRFTRKRRLRAVA